jgi:dihydroxy-acid dehydratase
MYTANTMASFPAEYPEKLAEADSVGATMKQLLEKNILPRDIMTRAAFENAMVSCHDLGNADDRS